MSSGPPKGSRDSEDESEQPLPVQAPQLGRLTPEEREAAIREPGETWRQWAFGTAFKWWWGLAILIVDSWIVAGWVEVQGWVYLAGSLAAAIYLELLSYQYLWHAYNPEFHGKFHRTWYSPFEVGRWSPERADLLAGKLEPNAPDARQFL